MRGAHGLAGVDAGTVERHRARGERGRARPTRRARRAELVAKHPRPHGTSTSASQASVEASGHTGRLQAISAAVVISTMQPAPMRSMYRLTTVLPISPQTPNSAHITLSGMPRRSLCRDRLDEH